MPLIDNYLLDNKLIEGPSSEKYAKGTIASNSADRLAFNLFKTTGSVLYNYVQVSYNFGFLPKAIVIRYINSNYSGELVKRTYLRDYKNADGYSYVWVGGNTGDVRASQNSSEPAYVNETGFRLPVYIDVEHTWEAFG